MNNTRTMQELMNEPVILKTWELTIDIVNHSSIYNIVDILPALMFIKDKQMSDYYKNINEEPYIAYSLLFQWLGFYIDLTKKRKKKKK